MRAANAAWVLAVLVTGHSADALAQAEQISATRSVTLIHTYNHGAAIKYAPADTAHGCAGTSANSFVFIQWNTNPDAKAMLATVMLAFSSGKTVGFGVDGCYSSYGGGVPLVYRVDVAP